MKTIKKIILDIFRVIGFCVLLYMAFGLGKLTEQVKAPPQFAGKIPTVCEIQELVGAEPDGIIGQETKSKWNRAVCDQYDAKYSYR